MISNEVLYISEWHGWLNNEKRLSRNTIESYKRDMNSFLRFIAEHYGKKIDIKDLSQISEEDITGWFYKRLKVGVIHRSNARALSSIKSFFYFLTKKKKYKPHLILGLNGPKFISNLPRPLTKDQIEKIFANIKSEKVKWILIRNLSIVILMWGYGLRISEVLNLSHDDFDLSEIRIKGKGKKTRIIPIISQVRNFIKSLVKECPFDLEKNKPIFRGKRGGKLNATVVQKLVRDIRIKLFLPENVTPHSFRHTFATELLENLADLRVIQELMGHSSLSTTQKYTAVTTKRIEKMLMRSHPLSDG